MEPPRTFFGLQDGEKIRSLRLSLAKLWTFENDQIPRGIPKDTKLVRVKKALQGGCELVVGFMRWNN